MKARTLTRNKNGQMKIQQMAFVLLAVFVFFAIVALLYLSFRTKDIAGTAEQLEAESAKESLLKIASTPEFAWKSGNSEIEDCPNCVDFDKVFALGGMKGYKELWGFDYLAVKRVYPAESAEIECSRANYPNCGKITLEDGEIGTPASAFVAICRRVLENDNFYRKCEIGKIYASGRGITK